VTSGPSTLELDFHHFGVACRDIEAEAAQYALIGYERESDDFEDPVQGVRGRFLVGGGPRIELLSALDGATVLEPWLRTSRRMIYHQAFEVPDIERAIGELRRARAKVVAGPVGAVAFGGRPIAFLLLTTMAMVEVIQSA
jgi:methylmalonyl-CoA/ethylmalonyl-CoA epimerase